MSVELFNTRMNRATRKQWLACLPKTDSIFSEVWLKVSDWECLTSAQILNNRCFGVSTSNILISWKMSCSSSTKRCFQKQPSTTSVLRPFKEKERYFSTYSADPESFRLGHKLKRLHLCNGVAPCQLKHLSGQRYPRHLTAKALHFGQLRPFHY